MQQDNHLRFTSFATNKLPDDLQVEATANSGQSLPGRQENGDGFEVEDHLRVKRNSVDQFGNLKSHNPFY